MEQKQGILKAISGKTAGVLLGNSQDWYNPTPECKADIINRINEVKKLMGKEVILRFDDKDKYVSIEVIKGQEESKPTKETDWEAKERRSNRSISISYAKDLVISGIVPIDKLEETAKSIFTYIQEEDE